MYFRPGVFSLGLALQREEVVADLQAGWRKDVQVAQEQTIDLIVSSADGCCRGNQFGPDFLALHFPGAEPVDSGFVKPDERAEWSADEVQFVLNDEVRWP